MLVTDNLQPLFDITTKRAIELYNLVLGSQSKKQNTKYIVGGAIALVLYRAYTAIALPPKALRRLPYVNNLRVIWSTLRGDTPWVQLKKLYAPALSKSNEQGMYVVSDLY
jgi:hypothetical protein